MPVVACFGGSWDPTLACTQALFHEQQAFPHFHLPHCQQTEAGFQDERQEVPDVVAEQERERERERERKQQGERERERKKRSNEREKAATGAQRERDPLVLRKTRKPAEKWHTLWSYCFLSRSGGKTKTEHTFPARILPRMGPRSWVETGTEALALLCMWGCEYPA